MADALKLSGGPAAQKTSQFIGLVNKFFDVLNVNNFDEGKRTRNVFKDPIRPGDHRMKVSCCNLNLCKYTLCGIN